VSTIEAAFNDFTARKDIAIILINQHVNLVFPCVLNGIEMDLTDRGED